MRQGHEGSPQHGPCTPGDAPSLAEVPPPANCGTQSCQGRTGCSALYIYFL